MHYSKVLLLRNIDINTGTLLRPNYFDQKQAISMSLCLVRPMCCEDGSPMVVL